VPRAWLAAATSHPGVHLLIFDHDFGKSIRRSQFDLAANRLWPAKFRAFNAKSPRARAGSPFKGAAKLSANAVRSAWLPNSFHPFGIYRRLSASSVIVCRHI